MERTAKIFVAGHSGLVGSAITGALQAAGYNNLLLRSSKELDLRRQAAVEEFFDRKRPEYVFLAAAKVGGILANDTRPAEFGYDNLLIAANVIHAAFASGVKKLLFLGSTCVYPRLAPQPMKEEYLLTGELEPTNEAYAVAKIAGIELCKAYNRQYGTNFIAVMPTNLYGPNDNFDLSSSHVMPALIRKFHEAKMTEAARVVVWGTGTPVREFLHVDDLAAACLFLMANNSQEFLINIGTGVGITIKDLAMLIKEIVGYQGTVVFDTSKPDGTPVKITDIGRIKSMGWQSEVPLEDGILQTYEWFKKNYYHASVGNRQ